MDCRVEPGCENCQLSETGKAGEPDWSRTKIEWAGSRPYWTGNPWWAIVGRHRQATVGDGGQANLSGHALK